MIKLIENESKDQEVIYKLHFKSKEKRQAWIEILNQTFDEINSKKLFGVKLDKLVQSDREKAQSTLVPSIIDNAIHFLISSAAIKKEGLFRISGNHDNVLSLSDKLDRNTFPISISPAPSGYASLTSSTGSNSSNSNCESSYSLDFTGINPHDVAAILKKFIRELPDPLFPFSSYDAFISTCGSYLSVKISLPIFALPIFNCFFPSLLCSL